MRRYLSSWGPSADEASCGPDGLELMRQRAAAGQPYDVVVVDLMMPEMDGGSFSKVVHQDQALSKTPVLALRPLGLKVPRDGEACASVHLTKPSRKANFYEGIRTALGLDLEPQGAQPEPSPAENARTSELAGLKLRILVAEDNVVNQKIVLKFLSKLGHSADAVADGLQAVQANQRMAYDLILMDCQMPHMDGYEATAEIRKLRGEEAGYPHHRPDRERHGWRPREVSGCRHGRPSRQADLTQAARRDAQQVGGYRDQTDRACLKANARAPERCGTARSFRGHCFRCGPETANA